MEPGRRPLQQRLGYENAQAHGLAAEGAALISA
jgi:hypothetical protein